MLPLRQFSLALLLLLTLSCNSSDPEKPEQQARTLQPYAVHTLPLGIRLDSLQKILHGHSALFLATVPGRLYRIIPLNAYGNHGFGAVELYPDSTIRTYYWYSNIDDLSKDQLRYYAPPRPTVDIKPVVSALSAAYGQPVELEPYPNEQWYTWRNDSASINLTLQQKAITLTKTGPGRAIVIDSSKTAKVESKESKQAKQREIKKPAPKKQVANQRAVKKPVVKKSAVQRRP